MAMARTERDMAACRPRESPMRPKRIPPRGRMRKPAAKAPNEAISESPGSEEGKKELPQNTREIAVNGKIVPFHHVANEANQNDF